MPIDPFLASFDRAQAEQNRADLNRIFGPSPSAQCCDCGGTEDVRFSTPINGGRAHCWACWTWRDHRGLTFDPRPIAMLRREVA